MIFGLMRPEQRGFAILGVECVRLSCYVVLLPALCKKTHAHPSAHTAQRRDPCPHKVTYILLELNAALPNLFLDLIDQNLRLAHQARQVRCRVFCPSSGRSREQM